MEEGSAWLAQPGQGVVREAAGQGWGVGWEVLSR